MMQQNTDHGTIMEYHIIALPLLWRNNNSTILKRKLKSDLILCVIVVLDEVQNEVEHFFGTEILHVPEQSHSHWHGLEKDKNIY